MYYIGYWLRIFFVFLPCLPFFRSFRFRSPVFFLPIRRFVLPDCVSLHVALSFSYPLSAQPLLLRCLPCVSLLHSTFLVGFLSFPCFRLRFFPLQVAIVFPCWYVHIPFSCFSLILGDTFLFLFFSFPFYSSASLPQFRLLHCSS